MDSLKGTREARKDHLDSLGGTRGYEKTFKGCKTGAVRARA